LLQIDELDPDAALLEETFRGTTRLRVLQTEDLDGQVRTSVPPIAAR
jgi:hypothetical protein